MKNFKFNYYFTLLVLMMNSALANNIAAVCPGYGSEGGIDDNFQGREYLHYGYHIQINLTGDKKPDQQVNFVYIDTETNQVIVKGVAENNQITIDDLTTSLPLLPFSSGNKVSDNKNRKLLVWGLDYKGMKVGTEMYLNLKINNIGLEMHHEITQDLFGLSGDYSYSYKISPSAGFKIEQDSDSQFQQAGCGQDILDHFAFGHHYFMGNLNPKLIINVTGNIQYKLNHFTDYQLGWANITKSYRLYTTKVAQTN